MLGALGPAGVAHAGNFVSEADYDFDCDGVRDLVKGHAWASVNGVEGAGTVAVTYSGTGATHEISQATPGVPGVPEVDDFFGWGHAAYDRDLDGCDDLVVGVAYEDMGSAENAGMVTIIPGSPTGLDPSGSVAVSQETPGFVGTPEDWDWFGNALAAGHTVNGTPYLLIGAPGESGDSTSLWHHGLVYYLRSGTVTAIHQDLPGVAGIRDAGDYFGERLTVSDRYFAVGVPQEILNGDRWTDERARGNGIVHVFSHTLTSGRPTPVAAFHQDTSGISGTAEWGDYFGNSVSVIPYRPEGSTQVGALVAVGTEEDIGDRIAAGMAHLVYVSPGGSVRQLAAFTQDTAGITGSPETGDELGGGVVLANLDPTSTIAGPDTTMWAVAASTEETASGNTGAVHVLRATWQPGVPDIWLESGRYGLPSDFLNGIGMSRASATHLHLSGEACYAMPWRNLLEGASDPVISRDDDCL